MKCGILIILIEQIAKTVISSYSFVHLLIKIASPKK
jgi:hypothetical protein